VTPDDLVKHGKVPKELMKGKKNQKKKEHQTHEKI